MTANEVLLREWIERVWNQKEASVIAKYLTDDTIAHGMGPNGTQLVGAKAFEQAHALFCEAFPDIQITLGPVVCDGDMVSAFMTVEGTHQGDTLGIPATGKRVVFHAMNMARIENGKILEGWNVIDLLSVFGQVGAMNVTETLP